ncbi:MAG: hypothetical protein IPJ23_11915 [Ignavibacteriales bacterium]|nr:hypothetical protein [Ignavibacteriales bacterium]
METDEIIQSEQPANEMEELSHSDKVIGVFSEPTKTFHITSLFPVRTTDWIIPLLIVFAIAGIIRSVAMLNDDVYFEAKQKQVKMMEDMVKNGTLPEDQLDSALDRIDSQMQFMRGPIGWVINIVTTVIFGSIFFFIIVGIYFLCVKLFLKGDGNYQSALVASALPMYISAIQIIITGILTFMMGKIFMDTSVTAFTGVERSTILGFVLAKIDPFSIWSYTVLGIGLAKMFKSKNILNYIILVFTLWIIGGLIFFFLGQAFPFLRSFTGG